MRMDSWRDRWRRHEGKGRNKEMAHSANLLRCSDSGRDTWCCVESVMENISTYRTGPGETMMFSPLRVRSCLMWIIVAYSFQSCHYDKHPPRSAPHLLRNDSTVCDCNNYLLHAIPRFFTGCVEIVNGGDNICTKTDGNRRLEPCRLVQR
jgi:hypothetical protein